MTINMQNWYVINNVCLYKLDLHNYVRRVIANNWSRSNIFSFIIFEQPHVLKKLDGFLPPSPIKRKLGGPLSPSPNKRKIIPRYVGNYSDQNLTRNRMMTRVQTTEEFSQDFITLRVHPESSTTSNLLGAVPKI